MSRLFMILSLLVCSLLIKSSLKASWFSFEKQQPSEGSSDPQKALIDPRTVKREEALETLKRHPQLIRYIQENRESLGIQSSKAPTTTSTLAPQQASMGVSDLLTTLKNEQERSPQRPLFVSVNVNNQSLCSDVNTVHTASVSPPTEQAVKEQSYLALITSQGIEWASAHKKRCLGYCLIGCWGGIQLYLFFIRKQLSKEECWARWKNHLTLEELYRITTATLMKEIIRTASDSLDEWRFPLVESKLSHCAQVIQAELSTLVSYNTFLSYVQALPLQRLFLWNTTILGEISRRIQRLLYLKNSILSFMEESKASLTKKERSELLQAVPATF